jgi:hypothetical protein
MANTALESNMPLYMMEILTDTEINQVSLTKGYFTTLVWREVLSFQTLLTSMYAELIMLNANILFSEFAVASLHLS